nr:nucleoside triphosphatase YtkD [Halalkalibacter urbisdiaboli]
MYTFMDQQGCKVLLTFDQSLTLKPKHVWIICVYQGRYLLTKHKERGLEFPGGKVEEGESLEEAAIREVEEETGATISSLSYIGQYVVHCMNKRFGKCIYFATIETMKPRESYLETEGPVLVSDFPDDLKNDKRFSFIMKDDVLTHCLTYLKKKQLV